jgi:hypothetical protein
VRQKAVQNGVEYLGEYSSTFVYPLQLTDTVQHITVHFSGEIQAHVSDNVQVVISIENDKGETVFWKGIPLGLYLKSFNAWWTVNGYETIPLPQQNNTSAVLKVYLWNEQQQPFELKNWAVKLYSQ